MTNTPDLETCIIWPSFPARRSAVGGNPLLKRVEFSDRAGTNYRISRDVELILNHRIKTGQERARLTTQLLNETLQGRTEPEITVKMIQQAKDARPMPPHERADRLLRYLVEESPGLGRYLNFGTKGHTDEAPDTPQTNTAMAWSESENFSELKFMLEHLQTVNWIVFADAGPGFYNATVTVHGHAHIAGMLSRTDSSQAFVAMWFDDSMDAVYNEAIAPAIEAAGYKPYRIDRDNSYQDTIEDKIIAEIRRSRFVVADFTHASQQTVRGSVYFEAGFAFGLGIPLIFTEREGSDLHFDTSHFLHIFWSDDDLPKLMQELTDRILAIPELGAGPLMGNP